MVSKAVSKYMSKVGKKGKGVPKNFSAEELDRRRELARGLAAKRKAKAAALNAGSLRPEEPGEPAQ